MPAQPLLAAEPPARLPLPQCGYATAYWACWMPGAGVQVTAATFLLGLALTVGCNSNAQPKQPSRPITSMPVCSATAMRQLACLRGWLSAPCWLLPRLSPTLPGCPTIAALAWQAHLTSAPNFLRVIF